MKTIWLCGCAAVAFLCGGTTGRAEAPLAPKIVCNEPVYDFGTRDNSGVVEHDYILRNEGTLSLEIRSVRASCGCTAVKSTQDLIAPGAEGSIHARFDLRGRSGVQVKTITVECNDPASPSFLLQLKGTATQRLRVQPASVFFGRIGEQAVRARSFEVTADQPIRILRTRTDAPWMSVRAQDSTPDGQTHRFTLELAEDLPLGNLSGMVFIQTDMEGQGELAITVNAFVPEEPTTAP